MSYYLVILNRYPELAEALLRSISIQCKEFPEIVIVTDRHDGSQITAHVPFTCLPVWSENFVYARNANAGIGLRRQDDCILCNDDCVVTEKNFFEKLATESLRVPNVGILSPLIAGGIGNPMQATNQQKTLWPKGISMVEARGRTASAPPICFVCVYLKRRMLDEVGLLDEGLTGYGLDDNDYCIRARRAEWKTAITKSCVIQHGDGSDGCVLGRNYSLSYGREAETIPAAIRKNLDYFRDKYDLAPLLINYS